MATFQNYLLTLGSNIKDARLRAGYKQIEVHVGTGLSYRHYQNIEAGRVNVTIETLHRLASLYQVRIEDLVRDP